MPNLTHHGLCVISNTHLPVTSCSYLLFPVPNHTADPNATPQLLFSLHNRAFAVKEKGGSPVCQRSRPLHRIMLRITQGSLPFPLSLPMYHYIIIKTFPNTLYMNLSSPGNSASVVCEGEPRRARGVDVTGVSHVFTKFTQRIHSNKSVNAYTGTYRMCIFVY